MARTTRQSQVGILRLALLLTTLWIQAAAAAAADATTETRHLRKRIVGGSEADAFDYPYFAQWPGASCGAVVVNADIAISAAHCYNPDSPPANRALYLASTTRSAGVQRRYVEVIPHPYYNPVRDPEHGFIYRDYDIVVMKTAGSMLVDPNGRPTGVQTIPMNRNANIPKVDDAVLAAGFGQLREGNPTQSQMLRDVMLYGVDNQVCQNQYHEPGRFNPNVMFCTGSEGGGKDTCQVKLLLLLLLCKFG